MRGKRFIHSTVMLLVSVMFICFYSSPGAAQNYLGSIRVQVKDFYSEAPLSGASILITPNNYTATTDAQGEALLEHITPFRNYQIRAEYDGYIAGEIGFVSVYADEETQSIIPLKKKASISGTVKGQGQYLKFLRWPLKDAAVILGRIENVGGTDTLVGIMTVRTDARGAFRFDNVDENSYKIVALKDGFLRPEILDIPVAAGEDKTHNFIIERRFSSGGQAPQLAITTATGVPKEGPYTAPARLYFTAQNIEGIKEFYWVKEN
ncbi:MAG: carboxypeptidase-like regulatory domain-containing protein, partial [Proteobacteria bacterium]|nr:carboxypeptidase-like regulatory domain-containing protein [Pseudomonadota bacterium]